MLSKSAITKLKVIFIINVIIVVLAVGGYYYVETLKVSPARPAEFLLTDLTIYPSEVEAGEPVKISANVTNIGDVAGNYSLTFIVDDEVKENRTIQLLGAESTIVDFTVIGTVEGIHTVKLNNLTGSFNVTPATLPAGVKVSGLIVSPYEVWVGETIRVKAVITNENDVAVNCSVRLVIDGTWRETKTLQLAGKTSADVEFTVIAESEGTHYVKVGTLNGAFKVVPTGMHTLTVNSSPPDIVFTFDGETHTTPYSKLLPVGTTVQVVMPKEHIVSRTQPTWQFRSWEDGSTDPTRTVTVQGYMSISATYNVLASCPALHVWNGSDYVYVTEVSDGTGYLGILDYFNEDGSITFAYSYPWDYVKLDKAQPQPKNGFYDMILVQKADEIFYIDSIKLVIVDHPANVDVYSTKGTYIYNLREQGKIYTVSKNLLTPVSAVNGAGENCLPQISKLDGVYTTGHEFQWDVLELNLGDLSSASQIKLVVAGTIFYSPGQVQGEWAAKFATQPGVKPFPPPYMEVKNENGSWIPVPEDRQFPLCDVGTDIFVVNLTGLFPTNNYSLRIYTFFDTRFDFIGVDTTPQQEIVVNEIYPTYADLSQVFSTNSTSSGNFTRYGDVTMLVLEADNKFVIGRQGDQLHVLFPADLPPVPKGMKRSFFVFISCWFKVKGLPYLSFTVDPLPFHAMSCFPYPPTESYPYDEDHINYILTYNTRGIFP
ncbi:MAG: CARDB domain-containing protein [Candidatus Bathyarchaeia archaeon]